MKGLCCQTFEASSFVPTSSCNPVQQQRGCRCGMTPEAPVLPAAWCSVATCRTSPPGQHPQGRGRVGAPGWAGLAPWLGWPSGSHPGLLFDPSSFSATQSWDLSYRVCGAANPAAAEPRGQGCSGKGKSDRARKSQTHPGSGREKENGSTLLAPPSGTPQPLQARGPLPGSARGRQQPQACPTFWSTAARPRACIAQLPQNKGSWGRTGWLPASAQRTQRLRARCGAWRCAAGELGWRPRGRAPGAAGGQGAGRDGAGRDGAGRQQRHHPHPDGKLGL